MDKDDKDSEMLSIRCPGCGQRFKVSQDLEGKMVECGSCEERFRVSEEVTIRTKKFYPGERANPSLERFSRIPLQSIPEPEFEARDPSAVAAVAASEHTMVEPVSPIRVILGFVAIVGSVIVALVLIFGGMPGGALDGAPMSKRLVLSVFTAIVATVLLFIANHRQKVKAVAGSALIAAVLMSLPFVFQSGLPNSDADEAEIDLSATAMMAEDTTELLEDPYAELKAEIRYEKLAEALATYGVDGRSQGKTAVGIWVRDIRRFNLDQVFDYLVRNTGANVDDSWSYPRPPSDYLIVLRDVSPDLREHARLCQKFGSIERVIRELQIIEVHVNNETFKQGELDKLKNPNDPAFYELNRHELESIDLERARSAVRRITAVEPKLYRRDIVKRLKELMIHGDAKMQRDVAEALSVWAEDGDGSTEVVRSVAERMVESGEDVPRTIMAFLVSQKDEATVLVLHALWMGDPNDWESVYGDMGAMIEPSVLAGLADYRPMVKISAIRLLGRVGTASALPALEDAREGASKELGVSIDLAVGAIRKRTSNQ